MKYRIAFLAIVCFCGMSCRKESLLDQPLQISMALNDTAISMDYPPTIMGNSYGFSTSMHYGSGFGASFPLDNMRYIQITFGQLTSQYPQVTYEMFKSLFVPGDKKYDSLVLAYNQVNSDRVEVDYRDEQGRRWSSTHLEFNNPVRKHTVLQTGSRFVIEEVMELVTDGRQAVKFKGYFNCTLYEENGTRTKDLKVYNFVSQVVKY